MRDTRRINAAHQTAVPRRPRRQFPAYLAIKDARAKREKGAITAEQVKTVEDAEIKKIIAKQEECGLQLATDGEFRRAWWHFDFLCALDGVEMKQIDHGIQFAGVQTKAERPDVVGKVGFSSHPMIEHFKFLKANTRAVPKMTIPSPTLMHFRFGRGRSARRSIPTSISSSTISGIPMRKP